MGTFASSMMLMWGAVMAVPIVLHFLRRHRRRSMPWGAMRFLREAVSHSQRRYRLWQWLLLAMRLLVVALLTTALARPMWQPTAESGDARIQVNRLRILIVDTSASMQAVDDGAGSGGKRPSEKASDAIAEVCRASAQGDAFLLIDGGSPPQVVIGRMSYRAEAVLEEFDKLVTKDSAMDLDASLGVAGELARQAVVEGWDGPIDILCFSDMQAMSWGRNTLDLRTMIQESPIRYFAIDCGSEKVSTNLVLGPIQWVGNRDDRPSGDSGVDRSPSIQDDNAKRWTIGVSHLCGDQPIDAVTMQLRIDGRIEQTQELPGLRVGETITTAWSTQLSPGTHVIEMVLDARDSLQIDNVYGEVVSASGATSIVLFGPTEADRRFIELALTASTSGRFRVQSLPQDRLRRAPPGREQVWILCNPSMLDKASLDQVEQFWRTGGSVIWWLGPGWEESVTGESGTGESVTGDSLASNQTVANSELGPTEWRAMGVSSAESVELDSLQYHSPILAPFQPYPAVGLGTLPVFRWWQIALGEAWDTAMTIQNADQPDLESHPLIATLDQEGSGRQVLIATPPGPGRVDALGDKAPWNALITWPVFLPLVQEAVRWSAEPPKERNAFLIGERMSGFVEATSIGKELRGPDGMTVRVTGQPHQGNKVRWLTGASERVGSYRWKDGALANTPAAYVNFLPDEGNLSRVETLDTQWNRVRHDEIAAVMRSGNLERPSASESHKESGGTNPSPGDDFGWLFLFAAIGAMFAESVIARVVEERF